MNELVQATFDYSLVNEVQASQLQAIYNRVLTRHMATTYEDGKDLIEAENIQGLPYEKFIAWAHGVFGWSESTIANKKNAYLYWGDFTPTVGVIEDRAMYLLSTKRVPESARKEAKERLNAGEDVTEEDARQIRDAHKAKEQAEAEKLAVQQQLFEEKKTHQTQIDGYNEQIKKLEREKEEIAASKVEIRKELSDEDKAKMEKLETEKEKLTQQRNNLSKQTEKLSADLDALREETEVKREQQLRDLKIRQGWRETANTFHKQVMKLFGGWPTPLDTQVFEEDDWDCLSQTESVARRVLMECTNLRQYPHTRVVEAEEVPIYAVES